MQSVGPDSELWACRRRCRVLTVSFHKFGNYFFPGTGDIKDIGESHGKYYSLNVPMRDGTDDRTFEFLFNPIMAEVMKVFQPGAVVLQCGAAQPLDPLSRLRRAVLCNLLLCGSETGAQSATGFSTKILCLQLLPANLAAICFARRPCQRAMLDQP